MAINKINAMRRYVKNVGKSFGYAAVDILKEYNPIVSDVFSSTKGAITSTYNTIKDFAFSSKSESEKNLIGELKDAGKGAFKNLMDDLKTGNWYNKARDEAADEDLMKALGFDMSDFDFDFNFDDDSWGEGDDSFAEGTKSQISEDKKNAAATIASMNMVGARVANAVNEGTVRSANYISNTIRETNKALYDLSQRGFSQTLLGINTVNSTISEFANKIGTPLTAHMQNATIFYTKTTEQLTKIEQHLNTIVQNTTPPQVAGAKQNSSKRRPKLEDMLSSSGLDINTYTEFIKANLADYKDTFDMVLKFAKGSLGIGSGSGKSNISLGKSMLTGGLKAMIPAVFKTSMEAFNKNLGDAIAGALIKASRKTPNSILGDLLKDILVPSNYFKANVDSGGYEKGAVAWDGKARKALTEVIPTTLFKILAALTGKEQRFNYETGKFVDVSTIKGEHEEMLRRNARSAGGDFRSKAMELAKDMAKGDKIKEKKYIDEIEAYFYNAYATDYGYRNFDKITKSNFDRSKFGISSDEVIKILRSVIASGQANSYFRTNATTRASQRNSLLDAERSGDHIFNTLVNGSLIIDPKKKGKKSNGLFEGSFGFYLKGIYEHTGYIAANLSKLVVTTGGGSGGPAPQPPDFIVFGDFDPTRLNRRRRSNHRRRRSGGPNGGPGEHRRNDDPNRELTRADFNTEEEYQEYLRTRRTERIRNELTDRQKSIKEKISDFFKGVPRGIKNLFDGPFNAAAKLLDTVSASFTTFLWGDPTGSDKGFFGAMKDRLSETFKSIGDALKNESKGMLTKLFEGIFGVKGDDGKRHGGFFGTGLGQDIKRELYGARDWMSDLGVEILYGTKYRDLVRSQRGGTDNGTAARGRKVTRSGIVSVSEGELIIPSELNPYYHGSTNKAAQIRNELANTRRFYSGKGGVGSTQYFGNYGLGGTILSEGLQRKEGDVWAVPFEDRDGNITRYSYYKVQKGNVVSASEDEYKKYASSGHNRLDQSGKLRRTINGQSAELGGVFGILGQAQHAAGDFYDEAKERFFGDEKGDKRKGMEQDKKALMGALSNLGKSATDNRGAIGAGALIGAGASLLTGGVVGPLLGASIGAATGFTIKSKVVQEFLFGKTDEEGNIISEGVFKKEFAENFKKVAPNMGKGAVVGGIGGLFLGSPVLGAMVGSTIGYVSASEKAKKFLFGDPDNPTLIGKIKDKIKERIPGMALGALGGLLVGGPFGITGNIILGSSIGFLATGEKVKNFFLGEKDQNGKRQGGFLANLKDKVFGNINELFRNMGNATKGFGKRILHAVTRKVKNVTSRIGKMIAKAFIKTKIGGKIYDKVKGIPGSIIDIAGRVTSKWSNKRKRKNLEKFDDVYDRRLGRNLTAMERIALRKEKGFNQGNSNSKFDEILAQATSVEDLDKISKTLDAVANPEKTTKQLKNNAISRLYNGLSEDSNADKIAKLISNDRFDDALKLAGSEDDAKVIQDSIDMMKKSKEQAFNSKVTLGHLKNLGINVNEDELVNLQDLIKTEKQRFKGEKDKEENQPGTFKYRLIHAIENISENVFNITKLADPDEAKAPEGMQAEKDKFNAFVEDVSSKYSDSEKQKLYDEMTSLQAGSGFGQNDAYVQRLNEINQIYSPENMQNLGLLGRFGFRWDKRKALMGAGIQNAFNNIGGGFKRMGSGIAASARSGALHDIGRGIAAGSVDAANILFNPFIHINKDEEGIARSVSTGWGINALGNAAERLGGFASSIPGRISNWREDAKNREFNELMMAKQMVDSGNGHVTTYWNNREMTWKDVYDSLRGIDINENDYSGAYAYGTPYARRGLASVSKGELILPYYGNYASGGMASGLLPMLSMMYGLGMRGLNLGKRAIAGGINLGKGISEFYRKNFGTGGGLNDNEFIGMDGKAAKVSGSDEDATKAFISHVDFMGGIHQYQRNEQGELVEQTNDRETDAAREKMDNLYSAITGSARLSAAQLAMMGMQNGLTADQIAKIAGGSGSGSETKSSFWTSAGNIVKAVTGFSIGKGITSGIKNLFNKAIYGNTTKELQAMTIPEKLDALGFRFNSTYRNLRTQDIYNSAANTIRSEGMNVNDYFGVNTTYNRLSDIDDANLSKFGVKYDDVTGNYVDLKSGEQFKSGYIDDSGNVIVDIDKNGNALSEADQFYSSNGNTVNRTTSAVETILGATPSGTNNTLINNYLKNTGGKYDTFRGIDKLDDMADIGKAADTVKDVGTVSKISESIRNTGSALINKISSTNTGAKVVNAGTKVVTGAKNVGRKIVKFVKAHWLELAIAAAIIIAAIAGVIYDKIYHYSDEEIEKLFEDEALATVSAGYNNYFVSVNEFKELIESNPNAASYFAAHPIGAAIHISGSINPEDKTCQCVFPYMIYAPAMRTVTTNKIYDKARIAPKYDKLHYDGKTTFHCSSESTSTNVGQYIVGGFSGGKSLVSYSVFMVKNFQYFRMYSTATQSEMFSRKGDSLGSKIGQAALNTTGSLIIDMISGGLAGVGDLSSKMYCLADYDYNSGSYKSKEGEGMLKFTDSFFSPIKSTIGTPQVDDYANSGLDRALHGSTGSNTFVESGSTDYSGDISIDEFDYRRSKLIQNWEEHKNDNAYINSVWKFPSGDPISLGAITTSSKNNESDREYINKAYDIIIGTEKAKEQAKQDLIKGINNGTIDTSKVSLPSGYQSPLSTALFGKGSGIKWKRYRGAGSNNGFISQISSKYKNIKYGDSTIEDIGCAPAAAANMVNALGGKLSMSDAINTGRKYTSSRGTDIGYFSDILGKSGFDTNTLNSTGDIVRSLMNHKPALLLGMDSSNTSKDESSWGPRPHYVVATGINEDGTINTLDSENKGPKKYKASKLLNGTMAAMNTSRLAGAGAFTDFLKKILGKDRELDGSTSDGETANSTETTEVTSDDINSRYSGISGVMNYFSDLISSAFGGNNRTFTNTSNYTGATTTSTASPYSMPSAVQSGDARDKIQQMLNYAKNVQNTMQYSQEYRDSDINGVHVNDCSSFVRDMYKNFLGVNIGGDTYTQLKNIKAGKVPGVSLVDYHPFNRNAYLNQLQPGDILYFGNKGFRGEEKSKYGDAVDDVSHVELYYGDGKIVGQNGSGDNIIPYINHGSGPTIRDFDGQMYSSSKFINNSKSQKETVDKYDRYIGAARYIDSVNGNNPTSNTSINTSNITAKDGNYTQAIDNENARAVWKYLMEHGYTKEAAAGIMGNVLQESGFKPGELYTEKNGKVAAGLFQWHDYKAQTQGNYKYTDYDGEVKTSTPSRFGALCKLADKRGKNWTNIDVQMEHMNNELNGLEKFWMTLQSSNPDYVKAAKKQFDDNDLSYSAAINPSDFKNLKNVENATKLFNAGFERCNGSGINRRLTAANEYYQMYGSGSGLGRKLRGGNSGLLAFRRKLNNYGITYKSRAGERRTGLYGGASGVLDEDYMVRDTKKMLDTLQTNIIARGNSGEMSKDMVGQLLMVIIEVLRLIATNTSSVGGIYSKLGEFDFSKLSAVPALSNSSSTKSTKKSGSFINSAGFVPNAALQNMVQGLASLAK